MDPITETKQLDRDDWPGFCSTFSNENRGSPVRVEAFGMEVGDQVLSEGRPFTALDYDPPDKGNRLVITTGTDDSQEHVINDPSELWLARDANGRIESLEIIAAGGVRTLITLG